MDSFDIDGPHSAGLPPSVLFDGFRLRLVVAFGKIGRAPRLAEQRLDVADDPVDTSTANDIADYVEDVITTNDFPSGNPSLIHPGEHYTLPAIGTPPAPARQGWSPGSPPESPKRGMVCLLRRGGARYAALG